MEYCNWRYIEYFENEIQLFLKSSNTMDLFSKIVEIHTTM